MFTATNKINSFSVSPVRIIVFLLVFFLFLLSSANAQNAVKKNLPAWHEYKGISIGMTPAQIKEKLGAPKSEDAEGLFYMFSETETAQFLTDANKNVRTISVVYTAENLTPPAFTDVFGKTTVAEPKPDGSIYKMIRYEDLGYWISYSRMAGEKAMVIVTIQKF